METLTLTRAVHHQDRLHKRHSARKPTPLDSVTTSILPSDAMTDPSLNRTTIPYRQSGRKSVSPDSREPQVGFEFLNFGHPSDAKASRARKTVRSHVTRQQHQREQIAAAAARRSRSVPQSPELSRTHGLPARLVHTISDPSTLQPGAERPALRLAISSPEPSPSTVYSASASPTKSPYARVDPWELYPHEWHSSINFLLDYYHASFCQGNTVLGETRKLQDVWYPFIFTDAALLHTTMLLAAAHSQITRGPECHNIDVFAIKGLAIPAINEKIQDPRTSTNDSTIAAIINMAIFESIAGDVRAYAVHMAALQKLVEMRGGLEWLGLDGLLEAMIPWVDANAARVNGSEHFFDESEAVERMSNGFPDPLFRPRRHPSPSP